MVQCKKCKLSFQSGYQSRNHLKTCLKIQLHELKKKNDNEFNLTLYQLIDGNISLIRFKYSNPYNSVEKFISFLPAIEKIPSLPPLRSAEVAEQRVKEWFKDLTFISDTFDSRNVSSIQLNRRPLKKGSTDPLTKPTPVPLLSMPLLYPPSAAVSSGSQPEFTFPCPIAPKTKPAPLVSLLSKSKPSQVKPMISLLNPTTKSTREVIFIATEDDLQARESSLSQLPTPETSKSNSSSIGSISSELNESQFDAKVILDEFIASDMDIEFEPIPSPPPDLLLL